MEDEFPRNLTPEEKENKLNNSLTEDEIEETVDQNEQELSKAEDPGEITEDPLMEDYTSSENEEENQDEPNREDSKEDSEVDMIYDTEAIDFRGESIEHMSDVFSEHMARIGPTNIAARLAIPGTWENTVFRALEDISLEQVRLNEAVGQIKNEYDEELSNTLKDTEGKITLSSKLSLKYASKDKSNTPKNLTGDDALFAFACSERGGGWRIPLYNSGISLDLVVPTGNDIQTMFENITTFENEMGSLLGAHYFSFSDLLLKDQIIRFIMPLILNSSYKDWKKEGRLLSIIKLPDLIPLVMAVAAMCHKDGYDQWVTKCMRKKTEDYPQECNHIEKITANLFDMITTRFSILDEESISFMVKTRSRYTKNTTAEIAKYQAGLGLEGEVITFGNTSFTMRIPTISEFITSGNNFLADIMSEIVGDNQEGRQRLLSFRYIRTFAPWIASVSKVTDSGEKISTSDYRVIIMELERVSDKDVDLSAQGKFISYINKAQMTYVGYPVTPCSKCGYVSETPSGLWTFDPFTTFFTLVSQYSNKNVLRQ